MNRKKAMGDELMRNRRGFRGAGLILLMVLVLPALAMAQEGGSEGDKKPKKDSTVGSKEASGKDKPTTLEELRRRLQEQLRKLETQSQQIESQRKLIEEQGQAIDEQRKLLAAMQTQIDQISQQPEEAPSDQSIAFRERLEKLEGQLEEAPEDPVTAGEFPGSFRVPGTNAAIKFGGFVKMSVVGSFDPLGSDDRFVVATIPVDAESSGEDARTSLSAQQSRINIDLRESTSNGNLRAFLEADFAGESEGARLRHAFGQFRNVLAGQTWSTLVDRQALPEELDFEGLSGRVRLRQAQIRWMPALGQKVSLALALEDPAPDVTNGDGVSQVPDFIGSIRWHQGNRHVQGALLLRQIRAQPNDDPGDSQSEFGWGLSWSGKIKAAKHNDRDHFLFQLNLGDGVGRYINDLGAEGGQDAVIDPDTGAMETLQALGMYVAYNHWWSDRFRSTFVYSKVYVDNLDIQQNDAYKTTDRFTGNLLFSPILRVDLGLELLWGRKETKDGQSGKATQIQFGWIYRY
ncbi:MAG: hypothetical protein E2P03_09815 [Acidobacteria bacterium]|nr:MAG: hypothetical protein E2P03_09815 [Acidobacteriota bacterium]